YEVGASPADGVIQLSVTRPPPTSAVSDAGAEGATRAADNCSNGADAGTTHSFERQAFDAARHAHGTTGAADPTLIVRAAPPPGLPPVGLAGVPARSQATMHPSANRDSPTRIRWV